MLTAARASVTPLPYTDSLMSVPASQPAREDHATFDDVYRLYCRRIYWLCLRMVNNSAEAEDLTQEVFLQVFQNMSQFEGRAAFSTWLHRVAINVVLMKLRKRSHPTSSLEEILSSENGDARSRISLARIDTRLAGTLDRMVLAKAIACLPGRYRRAFALHAAGYAHREIAARTKCSLANSKSNVRRARLQLRDLIQAPAPRQTRGNPLQEE